MRRELRIVEDDQVIGYVDDALSPALDPAAADVLSALVRKFGETRTAQMVLTDGWSNGYLYFAPLESAA